MAWFLVAATLVIVVAIAAAVIAWARVMRDGIRLMDRMIRTGSVETPPQPPKRGQRELQEDPGAFEEARALPSVEDHRNLLDN